MDVDEFMKRNHYEILFILRPLTGERLDGIVENYRNMVTENGDIHRFENCGVRQLAYSIKDVRRGYYILMNVECPIDTVEKIEKAFRFDDNVLRFLLIRQKISISALSSLSQKEKKEYSARPSPQKETKDAAIEAKTERREETIMPTAPAETSATEVEVATEGTKEEVEIKREEEELPPAERNEGDPSQEADERTGQEEPSAAEAQEESQTEAAAQTDEQKQTDSPEQEERTQEEQDKQQEDKT